MRTLRLFCSSFGVNLRLSHINGRWMASADTPDGPSIGLGHVALEAIIRALDAYDGAIDELLEALPEELFGR